MDSPSGEILAYVHWYTFVRADTNSGLRRVCKTVRGDQQAGGVIRLKSICFPCHLATAIDGECPPGINQHNVFDVASNFYINPFASHEDYELFR